MQNSSKEAGFPLIAMIAGSATAIFVADLFLPLGVAMGMLYIVPVLLSVRSQERRVVLGTVSACTVLTVLGFFLSGPGPGAPVWIAITNRMLSIAVLWGTAILSLQHSEAKERLDLLQGLLPICASCKKIRDDKGYWSQVEQYIETHTKTILTHGICPDCLQKWYPEFYPQVVERYPELFKDASQGTDEERFRVPLNADDKK